MRVGLAICREDCERRGPVAVVVCDDIANATDGRR